MVIEMGCKLGDDGYKNCMFYNSNGTCASSKKKCEYHGVSPECKKCGRVLDEGQSEYCDRCMEIILISPMSCPRCGKQLSYNGERSYIDISEHVSCCENDPNWKPVPRPTWHCVECIDYFGKSFYDNEGSLYSDRPCIPKTYQYAVGSFLVRKLSEDKHLKDLLATMPDCGEY